MPRHTSDHYKPRSLINSLSVDYNIIANCKPTYKGNSAGQLYGELKDNKICHKKKAIGELSDLGRLYNPNFHPDYKETYKKDPHAFNKWSGYCSSTIDKGFKNGNAHK